MNKLFIRELKSQLEILQTNLIEYGDPYDEEDYFTLQNKRTFRALLRILGYNMIASKFEKYIETQFDKKFIKNYFPTELKKCQKN